MKGNQNDCMSNEATAQPTRWPSLERSGGCCVALRWQGCEESKHTKVKTLHMLKGREKTSCNLSAGFSGIMCVVSRSAIQSRRQWLIWSFSVTEHVQMKYYQKQEGRGKRICKGNIKSGWLFEPLCRHQGQWKAVAWSRFTRRNE